jgi:hypothetical protein
LAAEPQPAAAAPAPEVGDGAPAAPAPEPEAGDGTPAAAADPDADDEALKVTTVARHAAPEGRLPPDGGWQVGSRVRCRWADDDGGGVTWYGASVTEVVDASGETATLKILYDDYAADDAAGQDMITVPDDDTVTCCAADQHEDKHWLKGQTTVAEEESSDDVSKEEKVREAALQATETPFGIALAAHAASANLVVAGATVDGFAPPTDAMLAAAAGACAAALPDGDGEALSSVRLAREYYDHWRPEKVRAIILGESHVFTEPEEQVERRLSDAAFERLQRVHGYDGPRGYVRLVNCLCYGERELCVDPSGADRGSTQFWQLLAASSRELAPATPETPIIGGRGGQLNDVIKKGSPRLEDRLAAKFRVMRDLKARGLWLLDTCVVGWYIPQQTYYVRSRNGEVQRKAKERPPKRCKTPALALSWELYTKHVIRAAAAEGHLKALVPLGKEVFEAIGIDRFRAAAPGAVVLDEAFPAPNAWVKGGYAPYYAYLSAICAPEADIKNIPVPLSTVVSGQKANSEGAPAAAPTAVVTPSKVSKPRGRAPLGATWDYAKSAWVHGGGAAAPVPTVEPTEAEPAAVDEEEFAAADDEWADWRGCICDGPYYGNMVGCDGGCNNWFHFACVGLTRMPRGEWVCDDCVAKRAERWRRLDAAASKPTPKSKPAAKPSAPTPRPAPEDRCRARKEVAPKRSAQRPSAKPAAKRSRALKPPAPRTRPAAPARPARTG